MNFDAVVVGAGFAGLYMLHRLRGLGLSARVFEAGERRRRHLVLEPLPGRALRRREHGLLVLVLRRAAAGVAVDRALRRPAGDPALRRTTSPTASTCAATSSSTTRVTAAVFDEAASRWAIAHRPRRPRIARGSASWPPAACRSPRCPTFQGLETFEGDWYHTGRGRTRASTSPASGSASSAPARPPSSRSRSSPSRPPRSTVFQRTPNFSMPGAERAARPGVRAPGEGRLRRVPAPGPRVARAASWRDRERRRPRWRCPPRSGEREYERAGARRPRLLGAFTDLLIEQGGQRHRGRVRPRQDPRDRARPGGRRAAVPADYPLGTKRALRRHRLLRRRSTATTSTLVDVSAAPDRGDHADGAAHGRARSTSSTSSSSPPASTR